MDIKINNKNEIINKSNISLLELIDDKKMNDTMLVTKINGELIRAEARSETKINENDDIIILKIINGG